MRQRERRGMRKPGWKLGFLIVTPTLLNECQANASILNGNPKFTYVGFGNANAKFTYVGFGFFLLQKLQYIQAPRDTEPFSSYLSTEMSRFLIGFPVVKAFSRFTRLFGAHWSDCTDQLKLSQHLPMMSLTTI